MSLFPHKHGCAEAVDPLQSCVDAVDDSLRSQESLESDSPKHGSRCYGDIGQSRTNKLRSFRKGSAGNTKCSTAFRPPPLMAAERTALLLPPPPPPAAAASVCSSASTAAASAAATAGTGSLSGWQMPEQDVSSQTGLSCETVSSCDTQHLHEMRCIAVNREDLPLRGRGMRVRLISATVNSLPICALPACPGTRCIHALRLPSRRWPTISSQFHTASFVE